MSQNLIHLLDFISTEDIEEIKQADLKSKAYFIKRDEHKVDELITKDDFLNSLNFFTGPNNFRSAYQGKVSAFKSHSEVVDDFANGASIIFEKLQKQSLKYAYLSDSVRSSFLCDSNINCIITPAESGILFGTHFDAESQIIIQIAGSKSWSITPPSPQDWDYRTIGAQKKTNIPREFEEEVILKKGDIFFMPKGYWHQVRPLEGPSIHLVLSLNHVDQCDFLSWFISSHLNKEILNKALPISASNDTEVLNELVPEISKALEDKEILGKYRLKSLEEIDLNINGKVFESIHPYTYENNFYITPTPYLFEERENEIKITLPKKKELIIQKQDKELFRFILSNKFISVEIVMNKFNLSKEESCELIDFLIEEKIIFLWD